MPHSGYEGTSSRERSIKVSYTLQASCTECFLRCLRDRLMPVPDNFLCPISASIMVDPVATVDGCVYERQYIERRVTLIFILHRLVELCG